MDVRIHLVRPMYHVREGDHAKTPRPRQVPAACRLRKGTFPHVFLAECGRGLGNGETWAECGAYAVGNYTRYMGSSPMVALATERSLILIRGPRHTQNFLRRAFQHPVCVSFHRLSFLISRHSHQAKSTRAVLFDSCLENLYSGGTFSTWVGSSKSHS